MLLEEVVQIIELTDTDNFAEALELFNRDGLVSADMLPFMKVVFAKAPHQLCDKLRECGFKGIPALASGAESSSEGSYVVYNAERYSEADAQQWLVLQ